MTSILLFIAGVGVPVLCWALLHFIQKATKANERADYNEATAKEVAKQAGTLVEHLTDADVTSLLRRKATDKRKREAEGKR